MGRGGQIPGTQSTPHAVIAELLAEKEPENETIKQEAWEARQWAEQTARDTGDI